MIQYLQNNGFNLIMKHEKTGRFLMKYQDVCVLALGNNSFEVFKHVKDDICYSLTIRNLQHRTHLLKKTVQLDEL